MNVWSLSILKIAIPQFICQFLVTFLLPLVTKFALSYPHVKQDEEVYAFLAADIEIQLNSNKVNQINGKSSLISISQTINCRLF